MILSIASCAKAQVAHIASIRRCKESTFYPLFTSIIRLYSTVKYTYIGYSNIYSPAFLQMFLRELPQDISPGRIPLIPLDRAVRFVTPCDACGDFTPKRVIVLCGHIFCSSCCRIQESPEGVSLYCPVCRQNTIGERNELSEHFLKSMRFACVCAFEGSLAEIKEHLNKAEVDHTVAEDLNIHDQNILGKFRLDRVASIRSANSYSMSSRNKCYFFFELQMQIDEFVQTKVSQETNGVPWLHGDYPVEVFCKIASFDAECFLGVYIRMLNDHPSFGSWPLKKLVSFELYNTAGESVQRKEAATFAEGKPVWKGFIFACRPNGNKGWGFKKFCSLDKLVAPEEKLLCNGTVCVSVEFQELDGV